MDYKKDFRGWHQLKPVIDQKKERVFFHEREIWFCHLGVNIGYEQDGFGKEFLRPVIILRKFNNEVCCIIPLTKANKRRNKTYYFSFSFDSKTRSTAILSQIRLVDSKRLKYKIGTMSEEDFSALKTKIRRLFA